MSPSACFNAWPSAMPTSSVVWCWSMCRSPLALTWRSMRECRASNRACDREIRFRSQSTTRRCRRDRWRPRRSVSLVLRATAPLRIRLLTDSGRALSGPPPNSACRLPCAAFAQAICTFPSLANALGAIPESTRGSPTPSPPTCRLARHDHPERAARAVSVVIGGDGQVSDRPDRRSRPTPSKVRRLGKGDVDRRLCRRDGRRLHPVRATRRPSSSNIPGQLTRACRRAGQGLAHRPLFAPARGDDDRRRQGQVSLVLTGTGDVLEPEGRDRPASARAATTRSPPPARCSMAPLDRGRDRAQGDGDRGRHLRLHQRSRTSRLEIVWNGAHERRPIHRPREIVSELDRYHRRPGRRQARRRRRPAQPVAAPAA